jgi:2-keto-4-pentenoate hydratase
MLSPSDIRAVALELRDAELAGIVAENPNHRHPTLDWADARAIALERDRLRRDDGDTPIGYKLGWTSAAMREALGIDRPNWGTLWASQRLDGPLDCGRLRHPKVEPEIVYVAGHDLAGADLDEHDVIEAAAGWALGIEVVHPRYASYRFTWLDNTADNSSAVAIAVGAMASVDVNPAMVDISFGDGQDQRTGRGDLAMGSPAEAVAWLVRSLAAEDASLRSGEIVFTGGLTSPFDLAVDKTYSVRSASLPPVDLTGHIPETERVESCPE